MLRQQLQNNSCTFRVLKINGGESPLEKGIIRGLRCEESVEESQYLTELSKARNSKVLTVFRYVI